MPANMARSAAQTIGKRGAREAMKLYARSQTRGAAQVAREELEHDKAQIADADGLGATMLQAGQSGSELVGVMLTITIAAAVGFVGTKVTSEIDSSIDTTDGTNYDNASDSISQGFADAMGLTDIVFLVLMFTVIIGALLAFRSR